ncbi:MAG: hypothetical protein ACE5G2_12365 [Candidatus Krumholzibacteriia bacterium]
MPDDSDRYIPVERDGSTREPRSNVYFMIHALLASRVETGMVTEEPPGDEDVNVYLTHLLCGYVNPHYYLRISKYLSAYDSSIFERVRNSTSNRLKYTVYRTNADHILVSIGLFQNPTGRRQQALPAMFRTDDEVHVGRGKAYYDFAFTYSRSLFGRASGISDVLCKLSTGFEKYVKLLTHMRSQYLNFITHISEGELYHLQHSVQRKNIDTLRNEFLDAYSEWNHEPTPERQTRLLEIARNLEKLDPDFKFDLPEC